MRKNCGKQLIKKSIAITSACFEAAVDKILADKNVDLTIHPKAEIVSYMRMPGIFRSMMDPYIIVPDIDKIKEEVDSLYLEKLCALPTKDIEDIIWIHLQKKLNRATRTIEALTSEIVRRALMNDSSQSESKLNGKKVNKKSLRRKHESKSNSDN